MIPPLPVAQPGPPIRVVCAWQRPKSMRRAARLDGWLPAHMPKGEGDRDMTPDVLRDGIDWLRECRASQGLSMDGYDLVAEGTTPADPDASGAIVRPWLEAGANWWIDAD